MRYTSKMSSILLYPLSATLYIGLAVRLWQRRRGLAPGTPIPASSCIERAVLLLALLLHAITLGNAICHDNALHFGFAIALSAMVWLALVFHWVESFFARLDGLQIIGLPAAAISVVLPALVNEQHLLVNAASPFFRLHLLVAMLAYSLFTLAVLHALLMAAAERRLHNGRMSPLLSALPPLLTMESLLFRLVHLAFALLTITLVSGIAFSEELFGRALRLDHKTIFSLLSWVIFASLLLGRHFRGWRGRVAINWTLAGFIVLLLAYVGTRFVLEVLLGRTA